MGRSTRWLIFAPVAILALFSTVSSAEADVLGDWTYSQSAACGGSVEVVDNVITLHGPDQNGCSGAAHWVKIETTIPADVNTVDFSWSYQTTDGWVYDPPQYGINGIYTLITQQNNSSGTKSVSVNEGDVFTFRQYSIDTCCAPGHLSIGNLSIWESTTTSTTSTTTSTTTVPTTTVPVTDPVTTTLPETTTSSAPTSTSLAPEPTMPEQSTTSTSTTTSTTTTTTTTSTVPETTTTTEYVSPPVAQPPVVVEPEPIELPTIEDMEPIPVILEPVEEILPLEPPDTYPTVETPDTLPFVGELLELPEIPELLELPDTMIEPLDILPIDLIEELPPELVQALEDANQDVPLTEEQFEMVVESIADLDEGEAVALIEQILDTAVTSEQATELASNPDVLAVVTSQQAEEIFETLNVTELDNTQLDALVEAVQSAPTEVRKAFEKTINIFDDGLGNYVPTGSNVPVDTRRTLIAVAAGAAIAAAGTRRP